MNKRAKPRHDRVEHWTTKGDVRLFLCRSSRLAARQARRVVRHGSSMASTPTFD